MSDVIPAHRFRSLPTIILYSFLLMAVLTTVLGTSFILTDTCHPEAMSISVCVAPSKLGLENKLIGIISWIGYISLWETPWVCKRTTCVFNMVLQHCWKRLVKFILAPCWKLSFWYCHVTGQYHNFDYLVYSLLKMFIFQCDHCCGIFNHNVNPELASALINLNKINFGSGKCCFFIRTVAADEATAGSASKCGCTVKGLLLRQ